METVSFALLGGLTGIQATAKYRDPSPFDFAQGQDDDLRIMEYADEDYME
jgi:hypothetical protein